MTLQRLPAPRRPVTRGAPGRRPGRASRGQQARRGHRHRHYLRDLGLVAAGGCVPWRHFTWRTGQRHRPGLQYLVSTGRHHGFEGLEEQRFLLALDFAGGAEDVVSQPFRLRAETAAGWREQYYIWVYRWQPDGCAADVAVPCTPRVN
jgi:hypothetical protein